MFGAPLPRFKYDPSSKKELFAETAVEGVDYLRCQECWGFGLDFRFSRLAQHLKVHGLDEASYKAKYPGYDIRLEKTAERRKETTQQRYGVDNVFQAESVKTKSRATVQRRYGVTHIAQSSEFQTRRAATNLERYGVSNLFASADVQAKIRQTMEAKYGAAHAQQVPEIRARTEQTTLKRYGAASALHTALRYEELAKQRKCRKRERRERLIASGQHETCPFCDGVFRKITSRHKTVCEGWVDVAFPEPCLCGHESTSLTQMKRHRRTCEVWQSRDSRATAQARLESTLEDRYGPGVTNPRHVPGAEERLRATNLERYGAENPFAREASTFEKVQSSLEGKRFVWAPEDNPFSKPETQVIIRKRMKEKYGAESPQQVPEIRARTRATNLERYGHEEPLAAPVIRKRIEVTNMKRYGGPAPSCSPEVVGKARQTNLERWGVPWTAMHPDVRRKQLEAMEARWGSHFFASEEGKEQVRRGMLAKYGVEHALLLGEFKDKRARTYLERWGGTGTFASLFQMERVIRTCLAKVGVAFSEYDTPAQSEQDLKDRYGVTHPMQHKDYARLHLEAMAEPSREPNGLERRVQALAPQLLFTGNRTFWRWLPKLSHHKNPDFIEPGPDPEHPKRGVRRVVEAFGDFWHSRMFTGKAPFDHETELVQAYAEIGIDCLVVWESEVKADRGAVRAKIAAFLG